MKVEAVVCLDVDGEGLVVVLHELGEVEQVLQDLGRDGRGVEGRLQAVDALVPVLLVQLGPARHEARVEQLRRQ